MKGPRYVVGFLLTMMMWGISSAAAVGLRVAAFMMDYEKDYKEIRDEVDAIHEMQQTITPSQRTLLGERATCLGDCNKWAWCNEHHDMAIQEERNERGERD